MTLEDIVYDRDQAVLAFATLAKNLNWQVGFQSIVDDNDDYTGNVLLFIDTPWGVMRWELKPHQMAGVWDEYTGRIPDPDDVHVRRINLYKMITALSSVKRPEPVQEPVKEVEAAPVESKPTPRLQEGKTRRNLKGEDRTPPSISSQPPPPPPQPRKRKKNSSK